MDLEEFNIGINRVELKDEKIYYVILVQYKDLTYEISKRYSEFEELNCELLHFGFSALPNLPKKKIVSYKNSDYINYRKKVLNSYIQNLFIRPDLRCCALFLNFLTFYDKINLSVEIVKTKLINSIGSQKFSLNDLYINEKHNFIICVYEDKSNLSKMGKLWSLIEPDILGEIKIFSYNNDLTSTFVEKLKKQTIYKARNIIYENQKNEVIISGDDGKIHIYQLDMEFYTLVHLKSVSCHNGFILKMVQINDKFFSTCGYDNAFRLFNINDYKIISGGRCNKRLEKDKITTCHLLEYNNIVIGTDASLFFTYNMTDNPPIYLDTKKLKNGKNINCFVNTEKYLFIGYDNVIACYNYHYSSDSKNMKNNNINNEFQIKTIINDNENRHLLNKYENDSPNNDNKFSNYDNRSHKQYYNSHKKQSENAAVVSGDGAIIDAFAGTTNGNVSKSNNNFNSTCSTENTKAIKKIVIDNNISAQYIPPLLYDNNVLSLCVNKSKKVLYAGYEDAIIIWSIISGLIISSVHGHTNGVHCLMFMASSELLLSGGNGGNLKIWKCYIDNFKIWKPKKNYKTKDLKLANKQIYKYNDTNQNNFNFNESDSSDHEDKSSANSESLSINNLLDQTNKKNDYEIFDTSNYKKNLLNYNESTNVNSANSSRSNIFYDKNQNSSHDFISDVSKLDICVIPDQNYTKKKNNCDYNIDADFNKIKKSYQDIYNGYDSNNHISYDNPSNGYMKPVSATNLHTYQYNNTDQNNNFVHNYEQNCAINGLYEKGATQNDVLGTDITYDMDYKYAPLAETNNDNNPDKLDYINFNDINKSDNSTNLKNNIICVTDEDDDDDDLVSAFT